MSNIIDQTPPAPIARPQGHPDACMCEPCIGWRAANPTNQAPDWRAPAAPVGAGKPKKKMRKLSWAIIIFNVIMLIWMVGGGASAAHDANCAAETYQDACQAGTTIGAGIAIFALLFLTMMVDVILGVIWLVTRKNHQH